MKIITRVSIVCVVFLLIAGLGFAQTTVVDTPAQAKLMAKRAAQLDAYRNLAETVNGLRIDSQTTVKDFITQNDVIQTRLRTFLRGAKVINVNYEPDGTCEVEVEISVNALRRAIRRQFIYDGPYIRAKGYGAPNPVKEEALIEEEPLQPIAEWTKVTISATGSGVPPAGKEGTSQGKLLAARAAYADALRNLGEAVRGVAVSSDTYVRNFVTESDRIRTRFDAFIQGAQEVDRRYLDDGTCEVDVEIDLLGLDAIIAGN